MNGSMHPDLAPYRTPAGPPAPLPPLDGRAIASMVLGIVATALCCLPAVGPACGTLGIVLFAKFNRSFHLSGQQLRGRGMAIAGLVTGIIGAAFGLLYTVYWVVWGLILGAAGKAFLKF